MKAAATLGRGGCHLTFGLEVRGASRLPARSLFPPFPSSPIASLVFSSCPFSLAFLIPLGPTAVVVLGVVHYAWRVPPTCYTAKPLTTPLDLTRNAGLQ